MNARVAVIFFVLIAVAVLIVSVSFDPKRGVQQFTPSASAPQPGVCGQRAVRIGLKPGIYGSGDNQGWTRLSEWGVLQECYVVYVQRFAGYGNCMEVSAPGKRWTKYKIKTNAYGRVVGDDYFPPAAVEANVWVSKTYFDMKRRLEEEAHEFDYFMVNDPRADLRVTRVPLSGMCP